MVKKWIKAIFTKPLVILKSIYFRLFNKNEYMYRKRLQICNKCEDKMTIKLVGDICAQCGCILSQKTRIIDEKCDLCKW